MIQIEYKAQRDEQLEAARIYQATTLKHRIYRVGALVALAAAIWTLVASQNYPMIIIWAILAVFLWFDPVPLLAIRMSFRGAALRQLYRTRLDELGLHFDIGGQKLERPWTRYQYYLETPDLFVLVYGKWAYSVIPKRVFQSEEEIRNTRAMIERHVSRKG